MKIWGYVGEKIITLTFRDEYVNARRFGIAGGTGIVSAIGDLGLTNNEATVCSRTRCRLNCDVVSRIIVINHMVIALPKNILWRCGTLRKYVKYLMLHTLKSSLF